MIDDPASHDPLSNTEESPLHLNKFIYTNDNFPCLVKNGEEVEDPNTAANETEKYHRIARNGLRHLTYGKSIWECKLISWLTIKALFWQRDEKLLRALRIEVKNILYNAYRLLENNSFARDAEKRLEIFIINLLADLPFMDPSEGEIVAIPTKVNGQWEYIDFQFQKIDISPQKGFLARLLEDEDRLYAYGLVPVNKDLNISPHVLFKGSDYRTGQGAAINWMYNFTPGGSTGEGHDLTNVHPWLYENQNAKATGHSKGGTLSMILSVLSQYIAEANVFNPAPLSDKTLRRLNEKLAKQPKEIENTINVYVQRRDPVYLLGNKFPKQALIYEVGDKSEVYSPIEAHVHFMTGRKSIPVTLFTPDDMQTSYRTRQFIGDVKEAVNYAVFPYLYSRKVYKLVSRKLVEHPAENAGIAHVVKPLKFLFDLGVDTFLFSWMGVACGIAVSAGAIVSGCKIAIESCFEKKNEVPNVSTEIKESVVKPSGSTYTLAKKINLDQPKLSNSKDESLQLTKTKINWREDDRFKLLFSQDSADEIFVLPKDQAATVRERHSSPRREH